MTDCTDVRPLLDRYLALELEPEDEARVRRHLQGCAACRHEVDLREPGLGLALRLPAEEPRDDGFVAGVLAGVHQRKLQSALARRRRVRLAMAAGLSAIAILAGAVGVRLVHHEAPVGVAAVPAVESQPPIEPAFVEVEGRDVRLYDLSARTDSSLKVALVVDPKMEL